MPLNNLHDLLVDNLQDLYHAEKQLVAALPKMARSAKATDLRTALENHLEETQRHVTRLDTAFDLMGIPARPKPCRGMEGLIEEGEEMLAEEADESIRDAAIIGAAQKVEHYEMAGYGTAVTYAELLGETEIAELLSQTLAEEEAADEKLTTLAEVDVNQRALEVESSDSTEGRGSKRKAR